MVGLGIVSINQNLNEFREYEGAEKPDHSADHEQHERKIHALERALEYEVWLKIAPLPDEPGKRLRQPALYRQLFV